MFIDARTAKRVGRVLSGDSSAPLLANPVFLFFVGDLCDLMISMLLFVMLCVSLPPCVGGILMLTVFWVSLLIVGDSPDPSLPSGICPYLAPFSQGYAGGAAKIMNSMKLSDDSAAFDDDGFTLTVETPIFSRVRRRRCQNSVFTLSLRN